MTTPPAGGPGRRGRFDRLPASTVFLITAVLSFASSTGVRLPRTRSVLLQQEARP